MTLRISRLSVLVFFAFGCQTSGLSVAQEQTRPVTPKNVILFVADGCGPASITMARDFVRWRDGKAHLAVDEILVGGVQTWAANSLITDSAAGATAFSSGVKTNNGAIAVDTAGTAVMTVLELAEQRGLATGIVATSRITHATPAAFASHVADRAMEAEIAAQELGQNIEVILGGGKHFFLPEQLGGGRTDGRNLVDEADEAGYTVVGSGDALASVSAYPVLGLFANDHMAYEIDRAKTAEPSIAAMTRKAIDLLRKDRDGFFLMVEASRIDHAGHANDAAGHLHDILAFDDAVAAALDFARRDGETLVLSVSDHETGGLSLGRALDGAAIYRWSPQVLAGASASHGPVLDSLAAGVDPRMVLQNQLGIFDTTEEELLEVEAEADFYARNALLGEIVGKRAILDWTTTGHTAVDVGLYAFGPGSDQFMGSHDNTYIGSTLLSFFGAP